MSIILTTAVLALTWVTWTLFSLYRNYCAAKNFNLPIIICPLNLYNPLWIVTSKVLFPPIITILQRLPIGRWPRCAYFGWHFDDKYQMHEELGTVFVLCHPSANEVIVADADAASHVLSKRKDFIKPEFIYNSLNVFGENLDSVNGEAWQRHRRITAPSFNERVSASVWSESIRQATQMLKRWTATNITEGTRNVVEDTAYLALNVITYAGFGKQYDFGQTKEEKSSGTPSYRNALSCVLHNYTYVTILPAKVMKLPVFSQSIQALGRACDEFKYYMKETVSAERKAIEQSSEDGGKVNNLLGALIRASQAEAQGLTDDEIYGNFFIYHLAGHETTANTIATSISYLVANPQWQDWLHEEITAASSEEISCWTYETVWPRLKRCQAVMLETLRLHGSIVYIPKSTEGFQVLRVNDCEHLLAPNTLVTINVQGVHCNPDDWGEDALQWRPDRWITQIVSGNITEEELIEPKPGTFLAWADGPRVCPGKKFSQVEFAGVIATLFRSHRVRPRPSSGETEAAARERVAHMIEDATITAITLQMRRPKDVAFVWEAR